MEFYNYRVEWAIDVDATSPGEAARIAREFQLGPDSTANVFRVYAPDGSVCEVDLDDEVSADSHWAEDADWSSVDWMRAVSEKETRLGYREWVANQKLLTEDT